MNRNLPGDIVSFLGKDLSICETKHYDITLDRDVPKIRKFTKDIFLNDIKPYYFAKQIGIDNFVYNFLLEPLKNAVFHGGGSVSSDLIFNQRALVAGYCDGGDYFKGKCFKDIWENRKPITERNVVDNDEIGYGVGSRFLYDVANLIHIDSNNGILYVGLVIGENKISNTIT